MTEDTQAGGMREPSLEEPAPALPFFMVGVGTSAGGLEALGEFFQTVAPGQGIAYVVIQHLSPDFRSMMTELLPRHTKLRVTEAAHDTVPSPDRVYLLPAKKVLRLQDGRFQLEDRDQTHLPRPINVFFESLAAAQGDQCAAVILSGTGTDGTHGARVVKEAGGLVLAQEPASAKFDGMPNSVIAAGLADVVGPPPEIASKLQSYATHPALGEGKENDPCSDQAAVDDLVQMLRRHTGINFGCYKTGTMWRRIQRRTGLLGHGTVRAYADFAQDNVEELDCLAREILIGVTQFFRDREAWQGLASDVLPPLIERAEPHDTLRMWVAGCATGEEAYTLAMLVDSAIAAQRKPLSYQLFATDVRRDSLSFARRGVYPEAACVHIPAEYLDRYFERHGESLVVRRSLRDGITFAPHNLLSDPPFTRLELAICRNLLIYLNQPAQKQVVSRLQASIRQGGFLMLGASETVPDANSSRFRQIASRSPLFLAASAEVSGSGATGLHDANLPRAVARPNAGRKPTASEDVYEAVMAHYVPPGVAVNGNFDVVQVFGRVPSYVSLPPGRLNVNLLRMVPQPLSVLLNSAGRKALSKGEHVRIPGVSMGEREKHIVDVRLIPTRNLPGVQHGLLVFFEEPMHSHPQQPVDPDRLDEASRQRIRELEDELVVTRENLHAAVQDLEATNEELQATNEEMTASNEELQSTNEELQSVNEELYSVNAEYQQKISELEELYSDLETLLSSIDAGVLFLDADLKIRRYNEVTTRLLPVRREDVGRPIREIAFQAAYPELEEDVAKVLEGEGSCSRELNAHDGSWWAVSIRPFRDMNDDPCGVIMTFRDVSTIKASSVRARRLATTHEMAADLVGVGHAIVDLDSETVEYSHGARTVLGLASEASFPIQELLEKLGPEEDASTERLFQRLREGEALPYSVRRELKSADGASVCLRVNVRPEREPESGHRVILFAFAQEH